MRYIYLILVLLLASTAHAVECDDDSNGYIDIDCGGTNAATATAARTSLGLGTAATRAAEDTLTSGSNLPDGAAIITYGNANWGGGSMTYPGAGIPLSTGSAWGTSYSLATLKTAMTLDLDDTYTWTGTHSFTGTVNLPSAITLPNGVETAAGYDVTVTVASGTVSLGTSSIADGTCATVVTSTATGTATTDIINWTFNSDPTSTTGYNPAGDLVYIVAYPTTNNVNFKVCNKSGSAITPGAITLNWRVQR